MRFLAKLVPALVVACGLTGCGSPATPAYHGTIESVTTDGDQVSVKLVLEGSEHHTVKMPKSEADKLQLKPGQEVMFVKEQEQSEGADETWSLHASGDDGNTVPVCWVVYATSTNTTTPAQREGRPVAVASTPFLRQGGGGGVARPGYAGVQPTMSVGRTSGGTSGGSYSVRSAGNSSSFSNSSGARAAGSPSAGGGGGGRAGGGSVGGSSGGGGRGR